MVDAFERFFPEQTRRTQQLERVFGRDVVSGLEKEAKTFTERKTSGGGRGRSISEQLGETTRDKPSKSASQLLKERKAAEAKAKKEQQRIQDATKKEQARQERISAGRIQPAAITPFTPGGLPPSRRQLGVEPTFIQKATSITGRGVRFLFGEQTAEDISKPAERITVKTDVRLRTIPTGTIIDPSSGITTTQTPEQAAQQLFVARGLGTPAEFDIQDIGKELTGKAQSRLEKRASSLQKKIDAGTLTVKQAEKRLKKRQKEEQTKVGKKFRTRAEKRIKEREGVEQAVAKFRRQGELDVTGLLEAGVTGAALTTPAGAVAVTGVGAAKLFSIPARPTREEKISTGISGGLDIAFGGAATKSAARTFQKQLERSELQRIITKAESQPFRLGEFGELRVTGRQADVFVARGARTRVGGRFTQEVDIAGTSFKDDGKFLVPSARGKSRTIVTLEESIPALEPTKTVGISETFDVGIAGFGRQTGKRTTATFGRSTIIPRTRTGFEFAFPTTGKQAERTGRDITKQFVSGVEFGGPTEKQAFAGITRRIDRDIFVSRTGPISRIRADVGTERAIIDANLKDIGLTRVIRPSKTRPTFEFTATGRGGLSGNLPSAPVTQTQLRGVISPTQQTASQFKTTIPKSLLPTRGGLTPTVGPRSRLVSPQVSRTQQPDFVFPIQPSTISTTSFTGSTLAPTTTTTTSSRSFVTPAPAPKLSTAQVQLPKLRQPQASRSGFAALTPPVPTTTGLGIGVPLPTIGGFDFGFFIPPFRTTLGSIPEERPKKPRKKKRKTRIRPSFTATTLGIGGGLPKESEVFGITPFQIRGITDL